MRKMLSETMLFEISYKDFPNIIQVNLTSIRNALVGDVGKSSVEFSLSEFERQCIPILRIALGIDSIEHALLLMNHEEVITELMLKFIKEGTDFFTVKGIKFRPDGSYEITRGEIK